MRRVVAILAAAAMLVPGVARAQSVVDMPCDAALPALPIEDLYLPDKIQWGSAVIREDGSWYLRFDKIEPGEKFPADAWAMIDCPADPALVIRRMGEVYASLRLTDKVGVVAIGDESVAFRVEWLEQSNTTITWRRGPFLASVESSDAGLTMGYLEDIAKAIDAIMALGPAT